MNENSSIYISVVIPLYNKQNAIAATLQSVLAQTYTNYEIIVVDDGSTDRSAEVAETILQECTVYGVECKGKVVRKANGGVSSARNRGIQEAKYDYIALLDGDDLWDEHYLEEQVKLIQDFPDAKMWGINYAFVKYGTTTKYNQGLGDGYRGYVKNYFETKHGDLYCSSSVIIRKNAFDITGYFDERIAYSEDLDMWYRIILHYPVVFYDKVLAYYNQDAENRCAYDLKIHHDLAKYLPYYIDKYQTEFDRNQAFSKYLCTLSAVIILRENYYFGKVEDRKKADKVVKNLRYRDIHPKYFWIFKTPRCVGWLVYKIVNLKKKLFRK
jgi:glycosyltransferase involved in cell wall biosynthesis